MVTKKTGAEIFRSIGLSCVQENGDDKIVKKINQRKDSGTYRKEEDASKQYPV